MQKMKGKKASASRVNAQPYTRSRANHSGSKAGRIGPHVEVKTCTCVDCFLLFVHQAKRFRDSDQISFPTEQECDQLTDAFCEAHGIKKRVYAGGKRIRWFLSSFPRTTFPSIEHAIFAWYGFDTKTSGLEWATLPTVSMPVGGPYPPRHIRANLFSEIFDGVPVREAEEILKTFGAMPSTLRLSSSDGSSTWNVRLDPDYATGRSRASVKVIDAVGVVEYVSPKDVIPKELQLTVQRASEIASQQWQLSVAVAYPLSLKIPSIPKDLLFAGHAGIGEADTIEGTHTDTVLVSLMSIACVNDTSVFLDLGAGQGQAMAAAALYSPRMCIGVEIMKSRCQAVLKRFIRTKTPMYVFHISISTLSFYTPATHVYCFSSGMPAYTTNAVTEAIQRSPTVEFVITDIAEMYIPALFERIKTSCPTSQMSGGQCSRKMSVYRRKNSTVKRAPVMQPVHPLFLGPVFFHRFPPETKIALMRGQLHAMEKDGYKKPYFSGVPMIKKPVDDVPFAVDTAVRMIDDLLPKDQTIHRAPNESTSLTYAEIDSAVFFNVFAPFFSPRDVFVDLGCGFGKLVMTMALASPTKDCVGIEIVDKCVDGFSQALSRGKSLNIMRLSSCRVHKFDLRNVMDGTGADLVDVWKKATIVFMNDARFEPGLRLTLQSMLVRAPVVWLVITTSRVCPRHTDRCTNEFCKGFEPSGEQNFQSSIRAMTRGYMYRRSLIKKSE